jgi:beta-ribofuranosylaminobenzene 5'-phosphate synthase
MMRISITSYPRLHFSLIDLSACGYRTYGGVGITLDTLPMILTVETSPFLNLSSLVAVGYEQNEIHALTHLINKVAFEHGFLNFPNLVIATGVLRHMGLGSGTRVVLSLLESLFLLNAAPADPASLQQLSGRGGASGQGLHLYFHGGICLDIGHPKGTNEFTSSDAKIHDGALPLVIGSGSVPAWPIHLLFPENSKPIAAEIEDTYFRECPPLPDVAVWEASYLSLFGVFGGAISSDYSSFTRAIQRLQDLPWKAGEIALQRATHGGFMAELRSAGVDAIAMSSFGPALFCFGSDSVISDIAKQHSATHIVTLTRNTGRVIAHA